MPAFEYSPPKRFRNSVYGCSFPAVNSRLKSLLLLIGLGEIGKTSPSAPSSKKLDTDFMMLPYQAVSSRTIQQIIAKFPEYTRKQLDNFFQEAIFKNTVLHINIFNELTNVFGYRNENNQIGCFLHIYRTIEQIALCLPIISIIKKSSFNNTFLEFKSLFEGGAKTDLAVLKKYSRNHLNSTISDSTAKFSFSRTSRPEQNITVIKRFIKQDDIVSEGIDYIDIRYKNIDTIIIGFRNQFFHYLFHDKNLSMNDIEYPEEFLEVCNPIFINYFAFLFFELLESELMIWAN